MACPLFLPTRPLPDDVPAAPLGQLHDGQCAAAPSETPGPKLLRTGCNMGYARGLCGRAAAAEADAVRFLLRRAADGTLEVVWSQERDHLPLTHGVRPWDPAMRESAVPVDRQIAAYVGCYLRQTGAGEHP